MILALVLMLLTSSTVSAKSERINFTVVNQECDWSTFDPGREIFTGNNFFSRDLKIDCPTISTIPEYTGIMHLAVNNNYIGSQDHYVQTSQPEMYFETVEGGIWRLKCVNMDNVIKCVGAGEGLYAGMQIFLDANFGVSGGGYIVDHSQ